MRMDKLVVWPNLFLTLSLMFSACNPDPPASASHEPAPEVVNYKKTLLVIGDDRSGSTSNIRKLTEQDYKTLFNAVNEKGGGTVAVCLIGNPQAQNREPYMQNLTPMQQVQAYDPKDTHLTLTEKSKIKLRNDKINVANQQVLQANTDNINRFIEDPVKKNILDYHPAGVDHTDLDDAISRINTLVNEPGYRNYDNIIVVMVSDGRHQPGKGEKPVSATLAHPKAKVYLVGWETPVTCFGSAEINKFSSKDAMITEVKNLK